MTFFFFNSEARLFDETIFGMCFWGDAFGCDTITSGLVAFNDCSRRQIRLRYVVVVVVVVRGSVSVIRCC